MIFETAYEEKDIKDYYGRDNKINHEVFDKAGISLPEDKVCNFARSAGMSRAESHGISTSTISRMSKHSLKDKLNVAYMSQSPELTMHGASGHFIIPEYKCWWTARIAIPDPNNLCKRVYYLLNEWRMQSASENGDKTESAEHFLNVVLPRLAIVIIQDSK